MANLPLAYIEVGKGKDEAWVIPGKCPLINFSDDELDKIEKGTGGKVVISQGEILCKGLNGVCPFFEFADTDNKIVICAYSK